MRNRTSAQSARTFLTDSESFLGAAQVLEQSGKFGLEGQKYYLASHSLELILKAFILHKGGTECQLRNKIGHDLSKAWRRATKLGLIPADSRLEVIVDWLAPYHSEHRFRYRQTGFLTLPASGESLQIIRSLIDQIGPDIDRALRAEIQARQAGLESGGSATYNQNSLRTAGSSHITGFPPGSRPRAV